MIRLDTGWLAVEPLDMRAGTDVALARVVQFSALRAPHHANLFANKRANRMKHWLLWSWRSPTHPRRLGRPCSVGIHRYEDLSESELKACGFLSAASTGLLAVYNFIEAGTKFRAAWRLLDLQHLRYQFDESNRYFGNRLRAVKEGEDVIAAIKMSNTDTIEKQGAHDRVPSQAALAAQPIRHGGDPRRDAGKARPDEDKKPDAEGPSS